MKERHFCRKVHLENVIDFIPHFLRQDRGLQRIFTQSTISLPTILMFPNPLHPLVIHSLDIRRRLKSYATLYILTAPTSRRASLADESDPLINTFDLASVKSVKFVDYYRISEFKWKVNHTCGSANTRLKLVAS